MVIGGVRVAPGTRETINVPVARRYTQSEVQLPVHVVRSRHEGPSLFVSAAVHGDEIAGVEIIRRLMRLRALRRLRGTLLAVPVVNVYGFLSHTRYLPDRRDLNRSFPGTAGGSLTSRLAHQFMREVVANATHGIDLHTGAIHRTNLPHVRACLDDLETARLAEAFGTPVVLNADVHDGSLRQAVVEHGIPMLLYEGGEALRLEELPIRAGLRGVLSVMRAIGMLPPKSEPPPRAPFVARSSTWIRAPEGGMLQSRVRLGAKVDAGECLGVVANPLGSEEVAVTSSAPGIVIGRATLPLVNEGDALFHVAQFDAPASVAAQLREFQAGLEDLGS